MPREERKLRFSEDELRAALEEFRRAHPENMPDGPVSPDGFESGERLQLRLASQEDGSSSATLSAEEVAVALMLYCNTKGIPLPRDSEKKLEVGDEGPVLILTLES
ncbi:MAG: hypothetical protein Q8W44_03045 [Candidatus Palauibacterales bacterium]|nr:hypothetical protein [Candidatus Palauibacterales bacterium]